MAGTAAVSGATFTDKKLQYANVNGLAIFEGDIMLGTIEEVEAARAEGIGITGEGFRWPHATVPFEIDPALPNQNRVTDAIAHWHANTKIRFVRRTAANAGHYPNFVRFRPSTECSSRVGKRGNQQDIQMAAGCTTGSIIHEIGHAIGLWHEQSREDRDNFVTINWANIDPDARHNFNQHVSDGDDIGAYDFGSIMHYSGTAFSINGMPTIVPRVQLPPGVVMGQRTALSAGDIAAVQTLYPRAGRLVDRSAEFGTAAAANRPTACVIPGLGVHNVAYRDTSGRLHALWRDAQGGTGTTNLTANAGAPTASGNPFAYVDTARNTEILLFRGGDGTVRSLYWSTGAVGHDNLGGTARAPKASGDPVGYYDPATDGHHVVYRGGDGHLHEMSWTGVAPVGYGGNLTGAISAPRAVGNPSAYSGGGYNIVVYRASNGKIMSVYWNNGPSGLDDLSGTAGTPTSASDPHAYYTAHNDTHQIVYRAGNGHLYELYWTGVAPVGGWDLTAAAGAPAAVGNPSSYYVPAENTKHVIYRSSDGRLHEIWWYPGAAPGYSDLTAFAGAPLAADDPAGFTENGHQHVAYRGTDNRIYEMRWG
ncbi:Dot/Icm T4SS effector Zinc-dependent metalloprotease LegP [Mycobacterium hubeiense]|uniref:Dot/Icm T4SS effector Zinc-dependent metalloprotease LegP n=1 Tax=Mycobacterium hubeiense TaxID=1867256 RepID=UPI0018EAA9D4|nr:Dot/Icm T4SS effector Zinc-dependent metalloprotease LegP [Mycobacterium sp. QGD 101]